MTSNEWHRLKALYHEAADLPEAERDVFIRAACPNEPALQEEFRVLLRDASDPASHDSFLEPPESPCDGPAGLEHAERVIGQSIGSYRIDRLIGSGGMGNVYLASRVEGDYRRQVAIKILKRGMDTDAVLRQFHRERQALAMLEHPHVARMYDGGATSDGRPYLVMEYIEGEPIDVYCGRRRLPIRSRLELFALVGEGVAFAHRHLVIHRDLKPANILVTTDGAPKLLDFGIARILGETDSAETTRAHDRRLTPEYASPEQISAGPISTATDIYSLGVVLYQLLTGRRPYHFKTRSPSTIESTIRNAQPPPPSAAVASRDESVESNSADLSALPDWTGGSAPGLARQLRGDLDTIVLTALRKEPDRRYLSVESFMGDIRRYLAGLPITARKDTLAYRTAKFVGRHRAGTAVGAVVFLAFAAGCAAVLRYARLADLERDAARTARAAAEASARAAALQRDEAYVARDEAESIAGFFNDALAAADPTISGPDIKVRDLLDHAVIQIETSLAGRPTVQAAVRSTIGRTYVALGLYDQAERQLVGAYERRRALLGDDHHDVAESRTDLASLRYSQGRFAEAESLLRQSLEAHERLRGHLNIDTARVLNDLGAVLRAQGKLEESERMQQRALAAYEQAEGHDSLPVAMSLNNLGAIHRARNEPAKTEEVLMESLRIRRMLLPKGHPLLLQSLHNLALTKIALHRLPEAETLLREAVNLGESSLGPQHPDLAIMLRGWAGVLMMEDKYTAAEPLMRRAMETFDAKYPADHPRRLASRADLARCLIKTGRFAEAESLLVDMLNRRPAGPLQGPWANAAADLIDLYERTGRRDQASRWRTDSAPASSSQPTSSSVTSGRSH